MLLEECRCNKCKFLIFIVKGSNCPLCSTGIMIVTELKGEAK